MYKYNTRALSAQMHSAGNPIYDDETFRYVLLNHKESLLNREDTAHYHVEQALADQFYGDFYGLLKALDVPLYLHWIATLFNGYYCSTDYDATRLDIYIPNPEEIDRIRNIHASTNGL